MVYQNKDGAQTQHNRNSMNAPAVAAGAAVPFYLAIWQLFVASVISLIQEEVVDNYKWLSTEEFTDALAMGNALPGPIATKMSAYVGYKVAGIWGATAALIGTVVPTALAMLGLAGLYFKYKDTPQMVGMLKAVRPVVVVGQGDRMRPLKKPTFLARLCWEVTNNGNLFKSTLEKSK